MGVIYFFNAITTGTEASCEVTAKEKGEIEGSVLRSGTLALKSQVLLIRKMSDES